MPKPYPKPYPKPFGDHARKHDCAGAGGVGHNYMTCRMSHLSWAQGDETHESRRLEASEKQAV